MGTIDLDIPRDRKGDFEPQIVKKNQTDISNIEDQVLSMYAKGMTTRDISAHLKDVYKADTEDLALTALDDLEEKWGKKYPASIGSWRNNWTQLSTYFKYPSEIRKLIYTTNSIENFNRQLRKVTKSKTIFPTDDALFKILYLAMMDVTEKWTGKAWDWGLTLDQLCIYFGDRIQPVDID